MVAYAEYTTTLIILRIKNVIYAYNELFDSLTDGGPYFTNI